VHVLIRPLQEMNPEADILNVRFTKSVIASKFAFTYEEAQIRKDDTYVRSHMSSSGLYSHKMQNENR
jgi:exoribonuclease R